MCNGYNNDGCKKKAGICYKGYVSSLEDGHKTTIYNDCQGSYILFVTPYRYDKKGNVKSMERNNVDHETSQPEPGNESYHYQARRYDPALARFTTIDPLAEKHPDISPYAYCADNPINAVDPDGKKIKLIGGTNILPILQGTVPEVYRSYITLDENGFVDLTKLKQGLTISDAPNSNNYKDLLNITANPNIVEISAPIDITAKNGFGKIVSGSEVPMQFKDPVSDAYNKFTPELLGSIGITLAPNTHIWTKNDKTQRGLLPSSERFNSTNSNYQILINGRGLNTPSTILDLFIFLAHELYGHLNSMFKGIDALHTPYRTGINSNENLENHISNAVKEVEQYNNE